MARPARAGARLRNEARLIKGEHAVARAVEAAMIRLTAYSIAALEQSGLDAAVLDPQAKPWRDALSGDVTPALEAVFGTAWDAIAAGGVDLDPGPYATRHIESVWNRLVGASDDVFDSIRLELAAGRQAGESIAALTQRINLHLTDADQWKGRASTIARTETIGANNAGARGAARATAEYLGVHSDDVQRTWMATDDERTRETHADADGQVIFGMDSTYAVGDADLEGPADPSGPPEEVVNCRCTETYAYPGDPDYEGTAVAASATRGHTTMRTATRRPLVAAGGPDEDPSTDDAQTGVVVVALPAASDAVQSIGPEQKHATLLYFGDVPGGGNPNDLLTDDFRALLEQTVATYAASIATATESVTGVEPLGDGGAHVWMLAGDTLPGWRTELLDTDSELVGPLENVEQYPSYTPHVTVGYEAGSDLSQGEADTPLADSDLDEAAAVESIEFDRLAVWWAGEQTEYPLGESSTTEEDDMGATTASGTLLARAQGMPPEEQIVQLARDLGRPVQQVAAALAAALERPIAAAAGDPAPVPAEGQELDAGEPAPVPTEGIDGDGDGMPDGWDKFWGVCVQENSQTGDGRVFAPEALYWGELPIPAGWQPQDAMGHDDAITMGRLDTLARVGDLIAYTGTYDMDGAGWEVQRLVEGGFLRGPSVDVDDCEAELLMPDGSPVDPFDMMFEGGDEDPILTITKGRIRSMVVCRVPAMEGTQAFICNGLPVGDGTVRPSDAPEPAAEGEDVAAIAAAASRIDVAPLPDASVFADPLLDQPTPMTVTADGRIFGHIAEWGVCHIGLDGVCTEPPPSYSDYAYFAVGTVLCAGGEVVNVGQITMDTGHASLSQSWRPAVEHYDNTGAAVADIAVGQDGHGIWMAGKVRDGVSPRKVAELRAVGKVSGDWREVRRGSGDLELVAALAVNVPGFPIPRARVGLSASGQTALVAAGIVPTPAERALVASGGRPVAEQDLRTLIAAAVTDELAARERRGRVEGASARIRGHRVARASARIGSRS